MIDPRVEEVLERLYTSEVEEGRQVPSGHSDEAFAAAEALGLVKTTDGRCRLTESGHTAARQVVRRHRLAECLLRDVLAVAAGEIEEDACRFEHILRAGLEEKVCILLGHPAACPHGKCIPPGDCCRAARAEDIRQVGPLSQGEVEDEGLVAYLATRDQHVVRKLMAMGILPGVEIRLIRRSPSYVFQVGYSQFTVDESLADKIFVHWRGGDRGQRKYRGA